jgi:hypothetical protein
VKRTAFAAALLSALLAASCATAAGSDEVAPSSLRPNASSTEAGLWMQADEVEKNIERSPLLVKDARLNAYVRGVVCKLAGARCASLRVYIVRVPYFNAYTMPNGAVVVWTGLLLRVENEAQLAMILGHEMTHYFNQHSLKNFESRRDTSNALAFLGPAALPVLLVANGVLVSYSRDQEREADEGGFDLATAAGYDPTEAAAIWRYTSLEDRADPNRPGDGIFGSDHPTDEERLTTMTKRGEELAVNRAQWTTGADAYRAATAPFRKDWLDDEMARGTGYESVALLERLSRAEPNSGLIDYYLGEAYRHRGLDGDTARAAGVYTRAIAAPAAPAAAWRDLGLLAMKSGDKAGARQDFTNYLAHAPDADDRAMVEFYISEIGGS